MLSMPYAIDPEETWEVDYIAAAARRQMKILRRVIDALRGDEKAEPDEEARKAFATRRAALEEKLAAIKSDLDGYTGGGPTFVVGHLPGGKRAELLGEGGAIGKMSEGKERSVRDRDWAREVIRWTVRDHRDLLGGRAREPVPFVADELTWNGEKRTVVSAKTLDTYEPILEDLALVVLDSQRLDDAEKNA